MRKIIILLFAAATMFVGYNCSKTFPITDVSTIELNLPVQPDNYAVASTPSGNKAVLFEDTTVLNNNKATIGRVLFYDKALSLHNNVACASCHLQQNAFSDIVAFSDGFDGLKTERNAMPIINLFEERKIGYFWDIRETKIENMVLKPVENHIEMGFEKSEFIPEKLNHLPYYKALFKKAYGDENATTKRVQESLSQFLFSIVSNNTKFDKGLKQNFTNFTQEEYNGKNLFVQNGCNNCHLVTPSSPSFPSSYGQSASNTMGNNGLDLKDADKGKKGGFKIPRMKNVAITGPYMHDGRFKTLEEVIDHYSTGIKNNPTLSTSLKSFNNLPKQFNFTDKQKKELIAFLNTLTDEAMLTDPKFSSPFKP